MTDFSVDHLNFDYLIENYYLGKNRHTAAISDPLAQIKALTHDIADPLPQLLESDWLADGDIGYDMAAPPFARRTIVLPKFNRYGERRPTPSAMFGWESTPFWTRHTLGVIEGARARRRRRKGLR